MESQSNVSAPTAPAVGDATSPSLLQRAVAIFVRPGSAWSGLERHSHWWFPLLLTLLINVGITTALHNRSLMPMLVTSWEEAVSDQKMTQQAADRAEEFMTGPIGRIIVVAQQVVILPVIMLLSALVVWFGVGFILGKKFPFRLAFAVVAWTSLVNIPAQIVFAVLAWSKETMKGIHTGFGILLPETDTPNKLLTGLGVFLDALGPLQIWYLAVLILGAVRGVRCAPQVHRLGAERSLPGTGHRVRLHRGPDHQDQLSSHATFEAEPRKHDTSAGNVLAAGSPSATEKRMRMMGVKGWTTFLIAAGSLAAGAAFAAPLTADDAVKIALNKSTEVRVANADIIGAKGNLWSAYSNLVPNLSLRYGRSDNRSYNQVQTEFIGGILVPAPAFDQKSKSTTPSVSSTWGILNLSSWKELGAAKSGMEATKSSQAAARNDVALATRRQFYVVVQSYKLAEVASGALKRSRDDERRVSAMYQVGSVSKSDLLKAQVATAQAELDSITSNHSILVERINLANQIGIAEAELGDVDTVLTITPRTYDESAIFAEASKNRPDLMAAETAVRSAQASHTAARMARLPYITASGQATFNSESKNTIIGSSEFTNSSDRTVSTFLSLNWDVFNLGAIDARVAAAQANLDRQKANAEALRRNLQAEVHQTLNAYNEVTAGVGVAQRGMESAVENLKLVQEKYNVGSATILELVDAQVQLQTAESNLVKALSAVRVVEAQVNRVRGLRE
jgi:outer membrane protein TolC